MPRPPRGGGGLRCCICGSRSSGWRCRACGAFVCSAPCALAHYAQCRPRHEARPYFDTLLLLPDCEHIFYTFSICHYLFNILLSLSICFLYMFHMFSVCVTCICFVYRLLPLYMYIAHSSHVLSLRSVFRGSRFYGLGNGL